MSQGLVNPADAPERRADKLLTICEALMRRVEQIDDDRGAAYSQFQRAVLLEDQVRERTRDLEHALDLLNESNARLAEANRATEQARSDLAGAIEAIQEGFALFGPDDRLILCNSRFSLHLPDIRQVLKPGISFPDYVAAVAASSWLDLPSDMTAKDWTIERLGRHGEDHAMFTVRLAGDRWLQVSEHRMAGGQTVVMQTDVSDILRAEREERGKVLDDQARLISATLEHIAQGVGIFDGRGRLVGFNKRLATMLSIPLTHLRSGLDAELLFSRMRTGVTVLHGRRFAQIIAWLRPQVGRPPLRFSFRRGEAQWFDVFAEEMHDGGFVMSVTDVSSERAAAQALTEANETLEARVTERTLELEDALGVAERANAARTRFVAAASHDLLQPLSAAKLYLSSIADDLADPFQAEVMGKAQNALASVQEIIGALLDISRLESGRAATEVKAFELGPVLDQLRDEFAPAATRKGLDLRIRGAEARIVSDPAYFRRILQNLIGNAIRYTSEGRVLVGVRPRASALRIGVWDTGPGIPPAEQENVFKEFHRLGHRASASEGLGLGLAIVDRACALLGHPLELASRPGHGTAFLLTVPRAAHRASKQHAGDPGPTGGWQHPGLSVLLIENDRDLRRALGVLLSGWGVTVIETATGAEALAALEREGRPPDAMLVDFQLDAGEVGIDAIETLRARYGEIPTRIITAGQSPDIPERARRIGIETLHKPIEPLMLHLFLGTIRPRQDGPAR